MENIFRDDAYAESCDAVVLVRSDAGIELDRTVFYPTGGGQPGDCGVLIAEDGTEVTIAEARKGPNADQIIHIPAEDAPVLAIGAKVTARIDWQRRHRFMRMHTCMHILSSIVPYPITGGQVGDGKGRVDFDIDGDVPDKGDLTAELNRIIEQNHAISFDWITDQELAAQPDLVKTMSVKPPTGAGRVRLIRIGDDIDLQPCGGTHVAATAEIGRVEVSSIKNKGKQNRRLNLTLI
jgi:misacylated tRNA(Ala) deacylase